MSKKPKNIAASVKQKLLKLYQDQKIDHSFILTRYALERFLYRLGASQYRDNFLLKGGTLFALWLDNLHRITRDIDLLGFGSSDIEQLENIFKEICSVAVQEPDGVTFLADTVQSEDIRAKKVYSGVRIKFEARIENAKCMVQVDIGFGDAVTPDPEEIEYPCLLDSSPAPRLKAYPIYTVIAEKFEAMVDLDLANTRMKDFYDVWILIQHKELKLDEDRLRQAIEATFKRRKTGLPDTVPTALTQSFVNAKAKDWTGFVTKDKIDSISFDIVINDLHDFFKRVIKFNG